MTDLIAPKSTSDGNDSEPLVHSFEPRSLSDHAYQHIEALILSGKFKGGERLNDSKLAKAFAISRGPVRNALTRLAEAGLVELIPYRGAFVRTIDLADVLDIYDIRAALERAGARAATQNMTDDLLAQLNEHARLMDSSFKRGDKEQYFATNLAFHQLIHQISGNTRLLELYERFTREQKLFRHFSLITTGIEESHAEHLRIMRAFEARDGEAAAHEMEKHVLSAKSRLEQAVAKAKEEYRRI